MASDFSSFLSWLFSKQALGALSVFLTLVAYIPYFTFILQKKTHPHMFSWVVWTIVNVVAFAAQYIDGAGAGAWMTGFTALLSFVVLLFAIRQGEKKITRGDWVAFIGSLLAILIWNFTKDPLGAVVLVSLIDILGCYPTLRKSYTKPWEEPVFSYVLCGIRSALGIVALENYTLVTTLYPIAMTLSNGLLAGMLLWRRFAVRSAV